MSEKPTDARAVLLKPGDLLIIGNVGQVAPEAIENLHVHLTHLKEVLGISGVVIFEQDVNIQSIEERVFRKFREDRRG